MKHPVSDLLSPSLVPELGSNITAGSAGYKHMVLILISAVGALPDKLSGFILLDCHFSVIAAAFAVIALRIQLRIHDVIINKLHHR